MNDSDENTCRIVFEPAGRQVNVAPHTSLLEAVQKAGLSLTATCGGLGRCGQCRLAVLEGPVSAPADNEKTLLAGHLLDAGKRLACSTRVVGNVKVLVPRTALARGIRLQFSGASVELAVDPCIHAESVAVSPPGANDYGIDPQRIADCLSAVAGRGSISAEPEVIQQLSDQLQRHREPITTYRRENEIVGAAPPGDSPLGVAVDLGSTKIAASLADLTNGKELASAGRLNPQIAFGEDVINRLNYAQRNPGGSAALALQARSSIDEMIGELAEQATIRRDRVADLCIVGNTVMTHLLLALPIHQLATAPFLPATVDAIDIRARDLGLETAPGAYVHVLPGIGGFIGADHVAMMLSTCLDDSGGVSIGIDIGTNTEIILIDSNRAKRMAVSCASGSAFEGGHIRNGMLAASGAIEAVRLADDEPILKTVDGAPPAGLCGSGIIDAVSELRRRSIIDSRGRLTGDHSQVREGVYGKEFVLVPAGLSGCKQDLVITQEDINQVQLAKGAIRAGLECLLETTETPPEAVREIVIAGAFGSFLNIHNACYIDLLPYFPNAGYRQIGNAALHGALRALLSRRERQRSAQIAGNTHHLELTTVPSFNRHFARGMHFPE